MDADISLLNRANFYPTTHGQNPDAVGIIKAQETVTGFLQLEVKDRRAVVIYGFGGVGKTTLASAVFSQLNLKDNKYKFCRLLMDELCKKKHIKALQSQLLEDLFGQTNVLRDDVEGQEKLTEAFKEASTQSMFVFIDNALKKDDLAKLLPNDLSCLPQQTKILVTTRKLDETFMFLKPGIQRHEYRVECLGSEESKQILCKTALGSADATFPSGVDIEGLVKICGGIPLVLEIVGASLLKYLNDGLDCNEIIDSLRESLIEGEGDEGKEISEKVVDVVYNSLSEMCKEAFLDIACFFHSWERRFVFYVVGELQLQNLVNASLVKLSHVPSTPTLSSPWPEVWGDFVKDKDGFIEVHDIVRARGRKLSQRDIRIMDKESWDAVQDTQKLKLIKGICMRDGEQLKINAEDLDLMHASLRIVCIGDRNTIKGKCKKHFENLRCLYQASGTCFSVDLAKLKHLRVFCSDLSNNPTELPSSLHYLRLGPMWGLRPSLNVSFEKLSSLKELYINSFVVLPPNFGHLKSLRLLQFSDCRMVTLPQGFDSLSALEGLSIEHCYELETLPASFGGLKKLTFLDMRECHKLWSLPENFGELTLLRFLRVKSYEGFSTVESCKGLSTLPESFGKLSSLEILICEGLSTLPESFGNLSSLKFLSLDNCEGLSTLPESFGNLSSLEQLSIGGSSEIVSLPNNFGHLKSLQRLYRKRCHRLDRLSSDFGCLTSLEELNIWDCTDLKEEAMDVLVEMQSLKVLDIWESPMLIKRWEDKGKPLLASGNRVKTTW